VPAGLTATLAPATIQVVLNGSVPDLTAIDASAIVATVNLSGLTAGQHSVQVHIEAPSGVGVGSITPDLVTVTLRAP
jgi:YbbR domain-containing protein